MTLLLLLASQAVAPPARPPEPCAGLPVVMIVTGPTHDAARMRAYGEAIGRSGLYQRLGGYYLIKPRPVAVFEGSPPANLTTLAVRFPCLANARAFWNSDTYQRELKPLRLNPSAGDYLVTVYEEAALRPDMVGKVGDAGYLTIFPEEAETLSAADILKRAVAAQGGEAWLNPRTLVMRGHATFWGPDSAPPRSTADDYRMWRVYDPNRTTAHAAEGKVLIRARSGGRTLFEAGFDGETTWTEKGVVPAAQAAEYWASNFGFGIIRQAGRPGVKLERVPDGTWGGRLLHKLRLTDARGQATLFGIDKADGLIRTMEFMTPRGWHMRTYENHVRLTDPSWVNASRVTLYYNGLKQNEVIWEDVAVNAPVDSKLFTPPQARR